MSERVKIGGFMEGFLFVRPAFLWPQMAGGLLEPLRHVAWR
jgi:hypothetical protein